MNPLTYCTFPGLLTGLPELPSISALRATGSIHNPFVTAKQQLWAGVRSDVYGSTVDGTLVRPSNLPAVEPLPITPDETTVYTIKPDDDAQTILNKYKYVYMIPGAVYKWSNITIQQGVYLNGRGAIVRFSGNSGPMLYVVGNNVDSKDVPVTFKDINFIGGETPDRSEDMKQDYVRHSALWFEGAWKTSILYCNFTNFKGAAIYYSEGSRYWSTAKNWQQQHLVSGCRFLSCRMGLANGGAVEYSLANNNSFFDCQVCFWVIGGNWRRVGNMIANCRCAYFHFGSANCWYTGTSGLYNPAHGSFTGNTLNHCDYGGNLWPTRMIIAANGYAVNLAAFYFNNANIYPPLWVANTHYYGDVKIMAYNTNIDKYCLTGCVFAGGNANQTWGYVYAAPAIANRIYLIGCFGNNTLKVYNIPTGNCTPPLGTSTTGTMTEPGTSTRYDSSAYSLETNEIELPAPNSLDSNEMIPLPPQVSPEDEMEA